MIIDKAKIQNIIIDLQKLLNIIHTYITNRRQGFVFYFLIKIIFECF